MRCQYVDPASGDRCDLGTPWRTTVRLETPPSRVWPREPGLAFMTWFCDEHQPDRNTLSKVLLAVRPSTIDLLINGQEESGMRQVLKSVRIWSSTSSARRQRAGVEDVPLFDSVDVTYVKEETDLTPRQYQVLTLLAEGRTGESIAKELGLSRATAVSEIRRVIKFLGWHGRLPPFPPNLPPAASAAGIP